MKTETPLTDSAVHRYWKGGNWSPDFMNFAQSLEIDRASLIQALQEVLTDWGDAYRPSETPAYAAAQEVLTRVAQLSNSPTKA